MDIILISEHKTMLYELKSLTVNILYGDPGLNKWLIHRRSFPISHADSIVFPAGIETTGFLPSRHSREPSCRSITRFY